MKPDFEKIVREAFKDRFGYVDPKLGRKVLRLVDGAYAAGLERAAKIVDEHTGQAMVGPSSDPGCFTASLIAASIRSEKEADHG